MISHSLPPLLNNKHHQAPSVFSPENLLREARRQNSILLGKVPSICVLDPDGDILRYVSAVHQAQINPYWACYHTQLYNFTHDGIDYGIIGNAVGASFAVLL